MVKSYHRSHIPGRRAATPRAARWHLRAALARASPLPPTACVAQPRKCARRSSVHSTARLAPGHGQYRRFRYPAERDPGGRAVDPRASAATRGWSCAELTVFASFDFEARRAVLRRAEVVAEAGDKVVVDHPGGLHESIDDGRAHELESARRKLL